MRYFREVSLINFCPSFASHFSIKFKDREKAILSPQTYLLFVERKGNLIPP
jgi:hypothetical protein